MQITVKRGGGGFAGLSDQIVSLDTSMLSAAAASELGKLVSDIGFFNLPANPPGQKIGADFMKYEVTVTDRSRQHTVTFNDDDAPATAPLRDLVRRVSELK